MPVVSFRLPDDDYAFLKERDMNVSEFVREALHQRIEWMRVQEAQARLAKIRFRISRPVEDLIREDRDHGH